MKKTVMTAPDKPTKHVEYSEQEALERDEALERYRADEAVRDKELPPINSEVEAILDVLHPADFAKLPQELRERHAKKKLQGE